MALMNFLKERRSVREFENRPLDPDDVSNIRNVIAEIGEEFGWDEVTLDLNLDSDLVFNELDGKAGYAGVMIKAPGYITVQYGNRDKMNYLKGAFVLGELETRIISLGLGYCIVTLDDNLVDSKRELFGLKGENIDFIIAVGYPYRRPPFNPEATSSRKTVDEIVFTDENFTKPASNELFKLNMQDLFYALRFSPSYKNKQPWRFLVNGSEVYAYVVNDDELRHSMTDMGIIMYYFQEMAKTMGIRGNWEIVKDLEADGPFIKLGRFKI
ncbi:MAG: nitroreductase [Tissierellia bacterium]|jgi:nitroreductase|nr:nitroreductase [Tissierellia bacterium]